MTRLAFIIPIASLLACSSKKSEDLEKHVVIDTGGAISNVSQRSGIDGKSRAETHAPQGASDAAPEHRDAGLLAYQIERRLEPSSAGNPTHATVRLLRKIGEGDRDLMPLLSETQGLVSRIVVDEGPEHWGTRYCGDTLAKGHEQAMHQFEQVVVRLGYDDVTISCANKPRPPRCSIGMAGHDHPAFEMRFADTQRGLELRAILEFDSGQSEKDEMIQRNKVEAEFARLTKKPCL